MSKRIAKEAINWLVKLTSLLITIILNDCVRGETILLFKSYFLPVVIADLEEYKKIDTKMSTFIFNDK